MPLSARCNLLSSVQDVPYSLDSRAFDGKEFVGLGLSPDYSSDATEALPCAPLRSLLFGRKSLRNVRSGRASCYDPAGARLQLTTNPFSVDDRGRVERSGRVATSSGRPVPDDAIGDSVGHVFLDCPERLRIKRRFLGQKAFVDSDRRTRTRSATYEFEVRMPPDPRRGGSDGDRGKEEGAGRDTLLVVCVSGASRAILRAGYAGSRVGWDDEGGRGRATDAAGPSSGEETFAAFGTYNPAAREEPEGKVFEEYVARYPELASYREELEGYLGTASPRLGYYPREGTPGRPPYSDLVLCCTSVDGRSETTRFEITAVSETLLSGR
jgi:hypothetical protein